MKKNRKRSTAAALTLSLVLSGTCSFSAQANVLDDIGGVFSGLGDKIATFFNDIGVGPAVKPAVDAVTDLVFTYQTQPDDSDMESLARSWAITAWLADEDKQDSNTYYFDNHTLKMVEDLAQIGSGYNQSKTPDGSYLTAKNSGILKAIVQDASSYSVEWVNYADELNMYLLQQMQEKKDAQTESGSQADALQTQAESEAQADALQAQAESETQTDALQTQAESEAQTDAQQAADTLG